MVNCVPVWQCLPAPEHRAAYVSCDKLWGLTDTRPGWTVTSSRDRHQASGEAGALQEQEFFPKQDNKWRKKRKFLCPLKQLFKSPERSNVRTDPSHDAIRAERKHSGVHLQGQLCPSLPLRLNWIQAEKKKLESHILLGRCMWRGWLAATL